MEELISIIVPIYNVEKYLKKCIETIINQTYKKLEIILINDGSTDRCKEICDEYKNIDNRIKVIHKNNEGIAETRNLGLKLATGQYIGFVDPDDYIENNMYEILYKNIKNTKSDISICSYQIIDDKNKIQTLNDTGEIYIYNKIEALQRLLKGEITSHQWNKLYKKEIFNGIVYPKEKVMEDIAITYLLFEKSDKIVYQHTILYNYIQRKTSILGKINEKLINDLEEVIYNKNRYLAKKYPELQKYIDVENLRYIKIYFDDIAICNSKKLFFSNKFNKYYKEYKELFKIYKEEVLKTEKNSIKRKEFYILSIGRNFYWKYYRLKQRMKRYKK